MKQLLLLFFSIFIISCQPKEQKEVAVEESSVSTENFDWLLGNWQRLEEDEGKETFENWIKINDSEYAGHGYTIENGDTIKQEKIKLTKSNNTWDIAVKSPQEKDYTLFTGVSHTDKSFVVENNEIPFPNKIQYWIDSDILKARVSNSEMNVSFEFSKIN